ncbi:calpain-C isoform X1 [Maniola hyperantus]|uniref:calpain-C isoform X1 n=1 Tax=Aphantopus hyperantus TaxID=2795564 RepID=UPI00156A4119|nr:calpain-C isoform X1 [Maniola hyperantus]XP_034839840.1 calpain-C isoform X1 [Maniola hyperantus]
MTDYELIKAGCLQRRELWEDPDFPAVQPSVFYHQVPPFTFEWKRAKELYANPKFIQDSNDTFDVVTGRLGDKWLLSCVGVLYLCKGLFYRVVPADQRIDTNYAGVFRFRLWWCGQWVEVLVDDRLPTVHGKLAFMHCSNSEQLWPALLEKAYAKMHGSYEALKYGNLLDGLADLTGGITESLNLADLTDAASLHNIMKTTSIVTAYRLPNAVTHSVKSIESGMNYRLYNVERIDTSDGSIYVVRLTRPLAPGDTHITHFILDHAMWSSIPVHERERLTSTTKGFWMLYSDFVSMFSRVEMVHLDIETSKAETSLADKQKWQVKSHQGRWKKGVSAGGCRNHVNFFHMNPQIQIVLNEADTIVISLNQHSIMEPKVIGFSIYKISKCLTETASPLFFKKTRSSINSQYTNSRQVSERCLLDAGAYLVIPTTFEPRQEANFSLRIYSIRQLKMRVLDCAPQMLKAAILKAPPGMESNSFAQYESQFLQLADEHKTINAFELQELLERCLPNDYIKSCATMETCRQIVLSMEKDGSGRITLSDFKDLICSLKHWQMVFRSHAPEKMSVLRIERFRDALREVGFVIPERALSLLVLKYMRKDGMLRFGDFVSAVVLLHRAFHMFFTNCSTSSFKVNLTFAEWLKSALTC